MSEIRQREQAVPHLWRTDSIILLFFNRVVFSCNSKALIHLLCQSDHVSHVQVRLLSFYTVRLIRHSSKDDALQMMQTGVTYVRALVLPTCSD